MRVIIGQADRLCALVDSLLGPARAVVRAPVNVHELIDHAFPCAGRGARGRGDRSLL